MNKDKSLVLNIQRMSTEDGPGIRTTVFLKGCSLSCVWCHNPESIFAGKEIKWLETRCIGCNTCLGVCKTGALMMIDGGIKINEKKCIQCFSCVDECPTLALELEGKEWELDSLIKEVLKDRVYFEKSEGGVTVSGGEPLLQPEFVVKFFRRLKDKGIHTALDTGGMCSTEALKGVLPYSDIVLYDIKLMDDRLHNKFVGQSNEKILKNILLIADMMRKEKKSPDLWIRTPIIPKATASEENIKAIGKFIADNLNDVVSRWDLCAFNNLCKNKYQRMDIDWMFKDEELMRKDEMNQLAEIARKTGIDPGIVCWSGATRLEES